MNCLFQENNSPEGGAILTQANVFITGCYFDSNVGADGGAIETSGWAVEIANSVFFNNFGADRGGAIYGQSEPLTLANCFFANNSSPGLGDGLWIRSGHLISTNCILWGNGGAGESSQIFLDEFGSATVNYSVIQGLTGNLGGVGNLGDDPMFVDQDGGDVRLMPGSPCIDAGNNWGVPVDEFDFDEDGLLCELFPVDLDGNPRFNADEADFDPGCGIPVVVDMGAYEYQFDPVENGIFADLNIDGAVGVKDLLILLGTWGPCEGCCAADFDNSGDVGVKDLLVLLGNWGPCP